MFPLPQVPVHWSDDRVDKLQKIWKRSNGTICTGIIYIYTKNEAKTKHKSHNSDVTLRQLITQEPENSFILHLSFLIFKQVDTTLAGKLSSLGYKI